jgi:hypothetical protein
LLAFAGFPSPAAASIDFTLNVDNGFAFSSDVHIAVGYITAWTLGSTALPADLSVQNPTNPAQFMNVVAVLSSETWTGNATNPISFDFRVSPNNRDEILISLATTNQPPVPALNFQIYNYDSELDVWYLAFGPEGGQPVSTVVAASPALTVASSAASDPASPVNYAGSVTFEAAALTSLDYSSSSIHTVSEPWGLPVTPPAVTTTPGPSISANTATLQGTVNPGNTNATVYFQYGTSPTLASSPYSGLQPVAGDNSLHAISETIRDLDYSTVYYFRMLASNSIGTSTGAISSFTSLQPVYSVTGVQLTNHVFRLNFTNESNGLFSVFMSTNARTPLPKWREAGAATEVSPGQYTFATNSPATNAALFFRVSSP